MKSIQQRLGEVTSALKDKGIGWLKVSEASSTGTDEQKLANLIDLATKSGLVCESGDWKQPIKTEEIRESRIKRNNGLGSAQEIVEDSKAKLVEALRRNGYSDPEIAIMADVPTLTVTEAEWKQIPGGQEPLYESLRRIYGHKEALLMMG